MKDMNQCWTWYKDTILMKEQSFLLKPKLRLIILSDISTAKILLFFMEIFLNLLDNTIWKNLEMEKRKFLLPLMLQPEDLISLMLNLSFNSRLLNILNPLFIELEELEGLVRMESILHFSINKILRIWLELRNTPILRSKLSIITQILSSGSKKQIVWLNMLGGRKNKLMIHFSLLMLVTFCAKQHLRRQFCIFWSNS